MLYSDRGYHIAHDHSRTKDVLVRVSASGGRDDHAKEGDSGVPERLGADGAGRGVPAVRHRRLGRAT
jgi:hypothetical protein